jgi:hypothetical protein
LSSASSQVGIGNDGGSASSHSSLSHSAHAGRANSTDCAVSVVEASGSWWGHGAVSSHSIAIRSKGAL